MKRNALILLFTLLTLMCVKLTHDCLVTSFDPYHIEQMAFARVQKSIFLTQVDRVSQEADQIMGSMHETDGGTLVVQKVGPAMNAMRNKLGAEDKSFMLMSLGRHKMVLGLQLRHESLSSQLLIFPSWDDVSDVRDVRWIWKLIGLRIADAGIGH